MDLSLDNFAQEVLQWCNTSSNRFRLFWPLKGGWEAWVQAEVAAYILQNNSQYDIMREQPIYQEPRQSVDWLINSSSFNAFQKIAIELKCQSFANRGGFIPGVQADLAKLSPAKLKIEYRDCQRVMMVIYIESQARDWVLQNDFIEIFNNQEVACALKRL